MTRDPAAATEGNCHICELNTTVTSLPFRERLYVDEHWRIAHGWSALPGWLVVAPRRHVESLGELTRAEAAMLGELLRAGTRALGDVVASARTYVVLFAEQPRYHHLHVHVVPRMDWFTERDRGQGVFRHLTVTDDQQLPPEERERLARAIAAHLEDELGTRAVADRSDPFDRPDDVGA